jgi:trk system potassium uptake protein TrkH
MQWCGGLVVVVLALLILGPGPEAQRLSDVEGDESDLVAGTRRRARWALLIYSTLTAAGIVLLLALGCSWFDALVHVLSAVSTGGFSSHDTSIAGLGGWPVQAVIMLLALAGAVSLARYRALAPGPASRLRRLRDFFDAETRMLLALCAIASLLLTVTMSTVQGIDWRDAVRAGPLLAVSAQSTAGFSPVDAGALDHASKTILILTMFIGGSLGSTAGGIKVFRLAVVLRAAGLAVLRARLPAHAVVNMRVAGRAIDHADLTQVVGVVACYVVVTVVSWFVFVLYGYDALDSLFEVVSATGTVGLSAGLAAPSLELPLKLVLCADMWMGRLEILAVLVLFSHRTWIGRRAGST